MKDKVLKEYIDLALENDEIASIEVSHWYGEKPVFKLTKRDPVFVPVQLCPKCNGDGHLGGYGTQVISTIMNPICDVCNGNKTIPMIKS